MKFKVTNIDKTTQRWRGELIEPGKSVVTENPPEESYTFEVKSLKEKSQKTGGK